jgi:hypothetical protein
MRSIIACIFSCFDIPLECPLLSLHLCVVVHFILWLSFDDKDIFCELIDWDVSDGDGKFEEQTEKKCERNSLSMNHLLFSFHSSFSFYKNVKLETNCLLGLSPFYITHTKFHKYLWKDRAEERSQKKRV